MQGFERDILELPSGGALNVLSITPDHPKAVVHINHGMAEHAARYERFAQALAASGYAVYAHDCRGHGDTTASEARQGFFAHKDGLALVLEDIDVVNAHIRARHEGRPVMCFGHSMGGILAFNYALRHPDKIDALAVWNTGFDTGILGAVFKSILKVQRAFFVGTAPSGLALKATFDAWNAAFKPNRTAFDWLSRDEAEVDKYVADPDCGFPISIAMWQDVLEAVYFARDDRNLAHLPRGLPVHLLAGAEDPCTGRGKATANVARRLEKAGLQDMTFTLLEGTRHESLNELNRDETTAGFVEWLDQRFGLGSSGAAS